MTPLPPTLRSDLDELARRRTAFVLPLLTGGLGTYFAVLVAYAYWPSFVRQPLVGAFNVAYLLAVALFVMTFAIGMAYARWARRVYDPLAASLRSELEAHAGSPVRVAREAPARPAEVPHGVIVHRTAAER